MSGFSEGRELFRMIFGNLFALSVLIVLAVLAWTLWVDLRGIGDTFTIVRDEKLKGYWELHPVRSAMVEWVLKGGAAVAVLSLIGMSAMEKK